MKLVSYKKRGSKGQFRMGFVKDDLVIDLRACYDMWIQMQDDNDLNGYIPTDPSLFYERGHDVIEMAKRVSQYASDVPSFNMEDVELGLPHPTPQKVLCIGKNYADHVQELESDIPEFPVIFSAFQTALVGPEDAIQKSKLTEELDYEGELALMIGKTAKDVKKEEAFDYISGYMVANDVTARDLQFRTSQWLQGKSLDNSKPLGPWLVTKDEVENPLNLRLQTWVNGEKRQDANTKNFIFDIPYVIETISSLMTLQPGDIIFTGTPVGIGYGLKPQKFLQAGDKVKIEIEDIGVLENQVE